MSQVNVNPSGDRGDRSGAAAINMVTVLIILVVLAVIAWFLFTGPLAGAGASGRGPDTSVTVNVPAKEQPAQPPAQPGAKP
jgi:hypothetical protein